MELFSKTALRKLGELWVDFLHISLRQLNYPNARMNRCRSDAGKVNTGNTDP